MKVHIKDISYADSRDGKHGKLHSFKLSVICKDANDQLGFSPGDEVKGFYQTNEQGVTKDGDKFQSKKFKSDSDVEVTIEENLSTKTGKKWYKIRPEYQSRGARYNQNLKREQSKYSGFSDSYVKDLLASGVLQVEDPMETKWDAVARNNAVMETWKKRAKEIFEHMVNLDKTIEE